jgi:hypothetical protein
VKVGSRAQVVRLSPQVLGGDPELSVPILDLATEVIGPPPRPHIGPVEGGQFDHHLRQLGRRGLEERSHLPGVIDVRHNGNIPKHSEMSRGQGDRPAVGGAVGKSQEP